MITFIIIIAVIVIIISVAGSKTKPQNTNTLTEEQLKQEMIKAITDSIKITVTTNTHNIRDKHYDSLIVDISNEAHQIIPQTSDSILTKYPNGVPYWSHTYVYSAAELNYASKEQQKFYFVYKTNFLSGVCLDIEDNSNYAFILLFDLFVDFETHKDLEKLKEQIKRLGEAYTKTKSYGTSFLIDLVRKQNTDRDSLFEEAAEIVIESGQGSTSLIQRKLSIGYNRAGRIMEQLEQAGVVSPSKDGYSRDVLMTSKHQIKPPFNNVVEDSLVRDFPDYYWTLGQVYGEKLGLDKEERAILDQLRFSGSGFTGIEFCKIEIIKLFFLSLKQLKNQYIGQNTTLNDQFAVISDLIARKHYKYRHNSQNYNSCMQWSGGNIYQNLFKICDNVIREHYGNKRKATIDEFCTHPDIVDAFNDNLFEKFRGILLTNIGIVNDLDEDTTIELNALNTTRWKSQFSEIIEQIDKLPTAEYLERIVELGRLNKKNPSLENIYYEASKHIAKRDKTVSLTLFMYYIDADLKSVSFDNKQLTKTIQKSLFSSQEQISEFEAIISEFISTRKMDIALNKISTFYTPKRKKISIDKHQIKEVQEQHSQTVELLNEYLNDDVEDENTQLVGNTTEYEATINIISGNHNEDTSLIVTDSISFTNIQLQVLNLFVKASFNIEVSELSDFAKQNGHFVNQLIDSINELCYETIDDLLIEEDGECYVINEQYFKMIIKQ